MSHMSMILSGLLLIAMAVFLAPNILAFNRGVLLRNIALWLGIFCALALFYKNFGPESRHPLFQIPASMAGMRGAAPAPRPDQEDKKDNDDGSQGFTPPKE